ncbi:MAG: hypothetical protein WC367_06535 [Methanoregula sp.]|jgi:hypothetical protein
MADLYVLASIPDQGKTTTAILLEKKLKSEGKRVACLQMNKDKMDVYRYLSEGCFHYTLPFEAARSRDTFERWVPMGYEAYILELSYGFSPVGIPFITLFDRVNEIISDELADNWQKTAEVRSQRSWGLHFPGIPAPKDIMLLWNLVHDRDTRHILTKTNKAKGPSVDRDMILHNLEQFAIEEIQPQMKLPVGNKKVIAVGIFPAEFWDIFPGLRWFGMDYAGFMNAARKNRYDLAVIGGCGTNQLKLRNYPNGVPTICYQPTVFLDLENRKITKPFSGTYQSVYDTIKTREPGTSFSPEGEPFSGYNNPYWVYRLYDKPEVVWKSGNITYCNGWVLPQYLLRDGFLEVD